MGANNNLVSDAYDNINKLEEGMQELQGVDADIIVYARLAGTTPKIYQIKEDHTTGIASTVLKTYNEHNSADPEVMQEVLNDMQTYAGNQSKGLILWSHATNWLPETTIKLMSFNDDSGEKTDLRDLIDIIPSGLDFLMFDACSMASVEVLYPLRNKAQYSIASPTEVLATSMPYQLILNDLANTDLETGLKNTAEKYYQYYAAQSGDYQSASISVMNNSYWTDFVSQTNTLITSNPILTIDREALQRLDFDPSSLSAGFDFLDFIQQQYGEQIALKESFNKLVVYTAHTDNFLGTPIRTFSGLSCYVPTSANSWVHDYYKTLSWTQDSSFSLFL
ncbi:clostripain-related cysteine peptidase [Sphingobacterium sp. LRF_L2]|uniref:clostripain-related cysteine peptidase n=1 Tax=Sphingobacterium sp. LRF_L2 TaxID=3369421 RepID=UPI003F5E80E6